jgi:hypothetical protein
VLGEVFHYLTAGATRIARRSGLLTQSVGLWSRARRRKPEWADHYRHCHAAVRRAMADAPRGGTVLILGSGLVEDVPIIDLAAGFDAIILVDIVHLKPVRRRLLRDPRLAEKLRFVTHDLTGVLHAITDQKALPFAAPNVITDLIDEHGPALVISAMCLSQLPRAVEALLASSSISAVEIAAICRAVVQRHIDALRNAPSDVVLLSDRTFTRTEADGSQCNPEDMLWGVPLPKPDSSWIWHVAPKGEISGGISFHHQVGAWNWRKNPPKGKP